MDLDNWKRPVTVLLWMLIAFIIIIFILTCIVIYRLISYGV